MLTMKSIAKTVFRPYSWAKVLVELSCSVAVSSAIAAPVSTATETSTVSEFPSLVSDGEDVSDPRWRKDGQDLVVLTDKSGCLTFGFHPGWGTVYVNGEGPLRPSPAAMRRVCSSDANTVRVKQFFPVDHF